MSLLKGEHKAEAAEGEARKAQQEIDELKKKTFFDGQLVQVREIG
eukprot:gene2297-12157_t